MRLGGITGDDHLSGKLVQVRSKVHEPQHLKLPGCESGNFEEICRVFKVLADLLAVILLPLHQDG